jgi:hypothetical protein
MVNHEVLGKESPSPPQAVQSFCFGGGLKPYFAKYHYLEDLGVDRRVVLKCVLKK